MAPSIVSHEEVLGALVEAEYTPGWITARRAADSLAVSTSTARNRLNDLVERGWATTGTMISRAHSRRGTKIRFYEVTERGQEAHDNNESF